MAETETAFRQVVTVVDTCVELEIPLPGDLLDELLAVAEGGLHELPAVRLQQLVSALDAVGHQPDGPWLRRLTAALVVSSRRGGDFWDFGKLPYTADNLACEPLAGYLPWRKDRRLSVRETPVRSDVGASAARAPSLSGP